MSTGRDNSLTKQQLRAQTAAALLRLTEGERRKASIDACALMAATSEWQSARNVLAFAPMPGEIDIWPLISEAAERGVQLSFPRFDRESRSYTVCKVATLEELVSGYFGIREPGPGCAVLGIKLLDLILVPGVAFDLAGRRLGRGKGFYDRLLETWRGVTCGVGYDQQVVAQVPVESHDVQLNCILTPTRFVRTRGP